MKLKDKKSDERIAEMKKYAKKVASTKESSRRVLVKAGIITHTGRLKKQYR